MARKDKNPKPGVEGYSTRKAQQAKPKLNVAQQQSGLGPSGGVEGYSSRSGAAAAAGPRQGRSIFGQFSDLVQGMPSGIAGLGVQAAKSVPGVVSELAGPVAIPFTVANAAVRGQSITNAVTHHILGPAASVGAIAAVQGHNPLPAAGHTLQKELPLGETLRASNARTGGRLVDLASVPFGKQGLDRTKYAQAIHDSSIVGVAMEDIGNVGVVAGGAGKIATLIGEGADIAALTRAGSMLTSASTLGADVAGGPAKVYTALPKLAAEYGGKALRAVGEARGIEGLANLPTLSDVVESAGQAAINRAPKATHRLMTITSERRAFKATTQALRDEELQIERHAEYAGRRAFGEDVQGALAPTADEQTAAYLVRSGQAETLASIEDSFAARLPDGGMHRTPETVAGRVLGPMGEQLAIDRAAPQVAAAEAGSIATTGAGLDVTAPGKLGAFQADADTAALGLKPTGHDFRLSDEVLARWAAGDLPDFGGPADVRAHLEDIVKRYAADPGKEAATMNRIEGVVNKVNEKTPNYAVTPEAARLAVDHVRGRLMPEQADRIQRVNDPMVKLRLENQDKALARGTLNPEQLGNERLSIDGTDPSSLRAVPSRYRPALASARLAADDIKSLVTEAGNRYGPETAQALTELADELPTQLENLVQQGIDPVHIIGGGARPPIVGAPQRRPGTSRKLGESRERQTTLTQRNVPAQVRLETNREVAAVRQQYADNFAAVHGKSYEDVYGIYAKPGYAGYQGATLRTSAYDMSTAWPAEPTRLGPSPQQALEAGPQPPRGPVPAVPDETGLVARGTGVGMETSAADSKLSPSEQRSQAPPEPPGETWNGPQVMAQMRDAGYVPLGIVDPLKVTPTTKFVPKALADGWERTISQVESRGAAWEALGNVNSKWKSWVLPLSPKWWLNNSVGNAFMATFAAGLNPVELVTNIGRAIKARGTLDETMPASMEGGSLIAGETGLGRRGLGEAPPSILPKRTAEGGWQAPQPIKWGYHMNQAMDDIYRSAVYLAKVDKGLVPEVAARETLKAMGGFFRMTKGERAYVREVIPFYSWMRHTTSLMYRLPLEHPMRVAWTLHMSQMFGDDQSQLPDFLKGNIGIGPGRFLMTSSANPFSDPLTRGNPLNATGLGGPITPAVKVPVQMLTGFDISKFQFTSRPGTYPGADDRGNYGFGHLPLTSLPGILAPQVPYGRLLRDIVPIPGVQTWGQTGARYGTGEHIMEGDKPLGSQPRWQTLGQFLGPFPRWVSQAEQNRALAQGH